MNSLYILNKIIKQVLTNTFSQVVARLILWGLPNGLVGKESACNAGDTGDTQVRLGRSYGKGNGNLPQYSCLGNPMDRGTLWVTVHGVLKSWLNSHSSSFYVAVQSLSYSDSLRPHGLQQARFPYPSPSPGACSNSSIKSVMPPSCLILCHPLFLLPSIFPASNVSTLRIRWPKLIRK